MSQALFDSQRVTMATIRVLRGYPGSETCQLGFRTTKWEDCSDFVVMDSPVKLTQTTFLKQEPTTVAQALPPFRCG